MSNQSERFTIPSSLFDFNILHGRRPGNPTAKGRILAKQILGFIHRGEKTIPNTSNNSNLISWLGRQNVEEVVWYLKQEFIDTPEKRNSPTVSTRDPVWGKSRLV